MRPRTSASERPSPVGTRRPQSVGAGVGVNYLKEYSQKKKQEERALLFTLQEQNAKLCEDTERKVEEANSWTRHLGISREYKMISSYSSGSLSEPTVQVFEEDEMLRTMPLKSFEKEYSRLRQFVGSSSVAPRSGKLLERPKTAGPSGPAGDGGKRAQSASIKRMGKEGALYLPLHSSLASPPAPKHSDPAEVEAELTHILELTRSQTAVLKQQLEEMMKRGWNKQN